MAGLFKSEEEEREAQEKEGAERAKEIDKSMDKTKPRNSEIEDIRVLDEQDNRKIKRHDGLPTLDDIKELFHGGGGCGEPEQGMGPSSDGAINFIIKIVR